MAAWRDRRLRQVSGATVNREIDVLSTVFNSCPPRVRDVPLKTRSRSSRGLRKRAPVIGDFPLRRKTYFSLHSQAGAAMDGTFSKGHATLLPLPAGQVGD